MFHRGGLIGVFVGRAERLFAFSAVDFLFYRKYGGLVRIEVQGFCRVLIWSLDKVKFSPEITH